MSETDNPSDGNADLETPSHAIGVDEIQPSDHCLLHMLALYICNQTHLLIVLHSVFIMTNHETPHMPSNVFPLNTLMRHLR